MNDQAALDRQLLKDGAARWRIQQASVYIFCLNLVFYGLFEYVLMKFAVPCTEVGNSLSKLTIIDYTHLNTAPSILVYVVGLSKEQFKLDCQKKFLFALVLYQSAMRSCATFQKSIKTENILIHSYTFSRASCQLHGFALSRDWFTGLSVCFMIGQSENFDDTELKTALKLT